MYEVARRIEYHEIRLSKHDRQFLDVYVELKVKSLSINGIPEDPDKNIMEKVLYNMNCMYEL